MLQIAAELADEHIRFYKYERTHLSTKCPHRKCIRNNCVAGILNFLSA